MFNKILIANRGEIACRVIQTAHRMGIRCVAVYSEADRNARHVAMADEAFLLGPAPSSESYLRADKILEIAKQSGAQAVHPGYGFLSENAQFAQACADNGIEFIGPPTGAIEAMGSKSAAKEIMSHASVPLVPGYHGDDQTPALLKEESLKCGFPQLLKAVAGGGGKGMRVVNSIDEFDEALESACREAKNAFGNPDMLIERYLTQPRHVEIQVFCDKQGNGVYLAERDCSVQRRHQKVIEEAPAPNLADETRKAMGEAAVRAAQAIDYVGAGTVEFLYDVDGSFYFMEMNTRLQVEHPVTELITGQDLVEWQLRIASGEPLPQQQDEIRIHGHALEARVYAEDPDNEFLPATGTLHYLRTPEESQHVRVDTGVIEGDEVSVFYDPMIAKLIVWDDDRDRAIARMEQALEEYRISGLKTNLRFLRNLAGSAPFKALDLDTGFIEKHEQLLFPASNLDTQYCLVMAACFFSEKTKQQTTNPDDPYSPFGIQNSWRVNSEYARPLKLIHNETEYDLSILEQNGQYQVQVGDASYQVAAQLNDDKLNVIVNGHRLSMHLYNDGDALTLFHEGEQFTCEQHRENFGGDDHAGDNSLTAPMNGAVVAVLVEAGQEVKEGQTLVIMEAMKMEHSLKAPHDGTVSEIYFAEGDLVEDGAELISLNTSED
ncbi:acetyl/propionyl/methylcrotonyl-CoA carboxylase subunit alpha [Amphritea balenae]|uniref:Biotin carboxylase n=1 Tax=Amphritea balenae TaxID=452629 RepID=A0A3P1SYE1_9GAMM|nr:acetyl/propionyl/methylcrotonyl-CoA carboxylase subunit alpha [Amphritea balenae]RRD01133.1 acetyl/propionyl/methylcrotonyl-CoA carboxylase subunit alpha [Amphritea balenae]GGK59633.1 3-methylcrotonyl-CoA carboxylase subunit alpha [Amphritea balenae]